VVSLKGLKHREEQRKHLNSQQKTRLHDGKNKQNHPPSSYFSSLLGVAESALPVLWESGRTRCFFLAF